MQVLWNIRRLIQIWTLLGSRGTSLVEFQVGQESSTHREPRELPVEVCMPSPTVCCECNWNSFPTCDSTWSWVLKKKKEMCVNIWLSPVLFFLPSQLYRIIAILHAAKQITKNRNRTVQNARGKGLGEIK